MDKSRGIRRGELGVRYSDHPVLKMSVGGDKLLPVIDRGSDRVPVGSRRLKEEEEVGRAGMKGRGEYYGREVRRSKEREEFTGRGERSYHSLLTRVERAINNNQLQQQGGRREKFIQTDRAEPNRSELESPHYFHPTPVPSRTKESGYRTTPPLPSDTTENNSIQLEEGSWSYSTEGPRTTTYLEDPRLDYITRRPLSSPSTYHHHPHSLHFRDTVTPIPHLTPTLDYEPILDADHIRRLPKLRR